MTLFLAPSHPEWHAMWDHLERADGDRRALHPETEDAWLYMGTAATADGYEHHFRHRNHPRTGRPERLEIPASEGFAPREYTDEAWAKR